MPGESDDLPPRARGAVRPPPSHSPGDAPDSIEVPRMSPPPPSLEAMIGNRSRRLQKPAPKPAASSVWVWLAVALVTAALTSYFMR